MDLWFLVSCLLPALDWPAGCWDWWGPRLWDPGHTYPVDTWEMAPEQLLAGPLWGFMASGQMTPASFVFSCKVGSLAVGTRLPSARPLWTPSGLVFTGHTPVQQVHGHHYQLPSAKIRVPEGLTTLCRWSEARILEVGFRPESALP